MARKLPCRSAILDGEVIVQDALGVSDFEALQAVLRSQPARLIFYAFDLLHLDGKDLRDRKQNEQRWHQDDEKNSIHRCISVRRQSPKKDRPPDIPFA